MHERATLPHYKAYRGNRNSTKQCAEMEAASSKRFSITVLVTVAPNVKVDWCGWCIEFVVPGSLSDLLQ